MMKRIGVTLLAILLLPVMIVIVVCILLLDRKASYNMLNRLLNGKL